MATYTIKRAPGAAQRYRIDYQGELNPAQYEAVVTLEGPLLVIAGAGSGKTRTLTYRVARLVETGVAPQSILLLTFTRRAAQEMIRRAEVLLEGSVEGVTGGTFHSFANMVLRRYGKIFDWPSDFTILDRGDSEDTIGLARARLGLDRKERRFARKQTLGELFSAAVNRGIPIAELVELEYANLVDDTEDILRCFEAYVLYKREHGLLDYDDLLVHLRDHLTDQPELGVRLARTLRYVMVDEYQDTNHLQAQIVELLVKQHGNVMAVGDDAQSIYGFRGADFKNIMSFPDRFPGTRVITLEENYRSTQAILDVTNAIIARAAERYSKTLFTRRAAGIRPMLVPAPDERFQSRFVSQRILELYEEGVPLSDIAVLFRSSFHSFDLEIELARAQIPFVKRGGFRFVETAHIKDVLAHLRVLANPRDAVSWHRVLLLLEGVGPKAAANAIEWLTAGARPASALGELVVEGRVRGGAAGSLQGLAKLLARLDPDASGPGALVQSVIDYYRPILERTHRDDAPKRLRDLEQFAILAERYSTLSQLLADMALEPPSDSVGEVLSVDSSADEILTLSTVHSAKGLEWHSVFVIWVADGRFPSAYSVDEDEIEEERRLMYVACTRAKENLVLSYPIAMHDRTLGFVMTKPSRFLDGVPPHLFDPVTLIEED
jgi:DNA helicase-2/ATP-dependent DNA helicase PcrA